MNINDDNLNDLLELFKFIEAHDSDWLVSFFPPVGGKGYYMCLTNVTTDEDFHVRAHSTDVLISSAKSVVDSSSRGLSHE